MHSSNRRKKSVFRQPGFGSRLYPDVCSRRKLYTKRDAAAAASLFFQANELIPPEILINPDDSAAFGGALRFCLLSTYPRGCAIITLYIYANMAACPREGKRMSITKEEQQELFETYKTPAHIRRHCGEVARVAKVLADALNEKGYHLDSDAIYGAASVHDVVRLQKDHDLHGAEILKVRNHPKEAELVRRHMRFYPFHDVSELEDIDILCLADRTVREDEYVGIDLRMDYLLAKPGCTPIKKTKIEQARKETKRLIAELDQVLGIPVDELCRKPGSRLPDVQDGSGRRDREQGRS